MTPAKIIDDLTGYPDPVWYGGINSIPLTDISICYASVAYLILTLNSICELVQKQFSPWLRKYFSEKVRQVGICVLISYLRSATCDVFYAHVVSNTVVLLPELRIWHRSILIHRFIVAKDICQSVDWYTKHSEFLS